MMVFAQKGLNVRQGDEKGVKELQDSNFSISSFQPRRDLHLRADPQNLSGLVLSFQPSFYCLPRIIADAGSAKIVINETRHEDWGGVLSYFHFAV